MSRLYDPFPLPGVCAPPVFFGSGIRPGPTDFFRGCFGLRLLETNFMTVEGRSAYEETGASSAIGKSDPYHGNDPQEPWPPPRPPPLRAATCSS